MASQKPQKNLAPKLNSSANSEQLLQFVLEKLDDIKSKEIVVLDVRKQTSLVDYMVIATGTSTQHVKSIAQNLLVEAKKNHFDILGHEGLVLGEWALVDLNDVLVHVMISQARAYYELEKLWSVDATAVLNVAPIANIVHRRSSNSPDSIDPTDSLDSQAD